MSQTYQKSNDAFTVDIGIIGADIKGIKPVAKIVNNMIIIDFGKYFFAFSGMHFNHILDLPQSIDSEAIKKYIQNNKLFHCVIVKDGLIAWNAKVLDIKYDLSEKLRAPRHRLTYEGKAIIKIITSRSEQ